MITVIDTGISNIGSVLLALDRIGASAKASRIASEIKEAIKLVNYYFNI